MYRRLLPLILLSASTTGCLLPASYVAGYSNPKAKVYVNKLTGKLEAEIGTDFTGKMEMDYDPESKKTRVVAEVSSKASDVNISEAAKAEAITQLQTAQMEMVSRNMEALTSLVGQLGGAFIASRPNTPPTANTGADVNLLRTMIEDILTRRGIPLPPSPEPPQ